LEIRVKRVNKWRKVLLAEVEVGTRRKIRSLSGVISSRRISLLGK